jgi:hypothetical protein
MMHRNTRGNWSLIGLLVAVLVVGLMAYIVYGMYMKTATGTSKAAREAGVAPLKQGQTPIGVAKDEQCRNNIDQVRKAIEMFKTTSEEGTLPASLNDLDAQGITKDFIVCPVGKEPYKYDPQTGVVKCVHPGHEGF